LRILDRLGNIEKIEAFGNRHGSGIDIPVHDTVVNRRQRSRLEELVLARLQCAPAQYMPKVEGVLVADNAMLRQHGADGSRAHAGHDFENRLPWWSGWPTDIQGRKPNQKQSQEKKNY
jgi:hypothetical protein